MRITQEMIDEVEKLPDDDLKQDLYEAILKLPEQEIPNTAAWIKARYHNLTYNNNFKRYRREQILAENKEEIAKVFSREDFEADPMDNLQAEQKLRNGVKGLSALLRDTADKLFTKGMTLQEIADAENEDVNAVYQRVHRIKKHLKLGE